MASPFLSECLPGGLLIWCLFIKSISHSWITKVDQVVHLDACSREPSPCVFFRVVLKVSFFFPITKGEVVFAEIQILLNSYANIEMEAVT